METKELLGKFMAGYLGMEYHGRPLSSTPSNMPLERCVDCLRNLEPFTVVLEPGDATRYTLAFLPVAGAGLEAMGYSREDLDQGWMVTRQDGRHGFVAALANTGWDFGHHNLGPLPRGNDHTADVIVLFISLLFSMVREGSE